jgi:hypothetical protein
MYYYGSGATVTIFLSKAHILHPVLSESATHDLAKMIDLLIYLSLLPDAGNIDWSLQTTVEQYAK